MLTAMISCGPRSGIHADEKSDEGNFCGNANETKQIDVTHNEKGEILFKKNCAVCHSSHTDQYLTGPGMKGVLDRLPKPAEDYFIKYTINNDSVYRSGDSYAKKIKAENNEQEMTVFKGFLTPDDVREIIKYLTAPRKPLTGDAVY